MPCGRVYRSFLRRHLAARPDPAHGRRVDFGPQGWATAKLLVTFAVLCFLVLMNSIIGLAAATRFFGAAARWPQGPLPDVLTSASATFIVASVLFAFSLGLARTLKPKSDPSRSSAWVWFTAVLQWFFYLYLVLVIATVPDEDALIPLIAHVEHWNNKRVFEQIYDAL